MQQPPSNLFLGDFMLDSDEQVFRPRSSAQREAILWLLGGLVALGIAILGFVVAVFARRGDSASPAVTTTMPTLVGIAAIGAAYTAASAPREVGVSGKGVRIVTRKGTVVHPWSEIGWLATDTGSMSFRRSLRLFDAQGRTLARLSDSLEGFDQMVAAIQASVAAKPDDTASRVQLSKARRSALFTGTIAIAFLALSVAVVNITRGELRAAKLLKEQAVPGEATIERRFLAPNGITPRLEYRVTDPSGKSATRNAQVERQVWDELENAKTVPVIYVPGEPAISRLATGEREDRDAMKGPLLGYGMPAVLAVMSLVFLASSVFMWRGYDIDLDPSGRPRLKRFGSGGGPTG
jgi:hypothetical protein